MECYTPKIQPISTVYFNITRISPFLLQKYKYIEKKYIYPVYCNYKLTLVKIQFFLREGFLLRYTTITPSYQID